MESVRELTSVKHSAWSSNTHNIILTAVWTNMPARAGVCHFGYQLPETEKSDKIRLTYAYLSMLKT
jgi:hypothetical protein